ncbi:hypothetical protein BDV06DRAFT_191774 [Aspergillus oleicola]
MGTLTFYGVEEYLDRVKHGLFPLLSTTSNTRAPCPTLYTHTPTASTRDVTSSPQQISYPA